MVGRGYVPAEFDICDIYAWWAIRLDRRGRNPALPVRNPCFSTLCLCGNLSRHRV